MEDDMDMEQQEPKEEDQANEPELWPEDNGLELQPERIRRIKDDFIRKLAIFLECDNIIDQLEMWCMEAVNNRYVPPKETGEHSLSNSELHTEYLEVLNGHMAKFLADSSTTEEEFFARCKAAQDADEYAAQFVRMMLAASEFEYFDHLMSQMYEAAKQPNNVAI